MTERFSVRPGDVRAHGGHIESIADQVEQAAAAARVVRADPGAYGKLCTMVPVMVNGLQGVLAEGIGNCAGSLRDTAGRLRATAEEYDATDHSRADVFERIRTGR